MIDSLRAWKQTYEYVWSITPPKGEKKHVSYERMLARLLDNIVRIDPDVYALHQLRMNKVSVNNEEIKENTLAYLTGLRDKLDLLLNEKTVF